MPFYRRMELFSGVNSVAGANFSARTAVDAGVGIDVVDVAFRDRVGGTYCLTCATGNTVVVNNVSHFVNYLIVRRIDSRFFMVGFAVSSQIEAVDRKTVQK